MTAYINDDFKISELMKDWYAGGVGRISGDLAAEIAGVSDEVAFSCAKSALPCTHKRLRCRAV